MHRTKWPARLPMYILAGVIVASGVSASAQTSSAAVPDRPEAELLRQRIAELEAQNAAIRSQLAAIQTRLERLDGHSAPASAIEVASTAPMVPSSTVAAPPLRPAAAAAPQAPQPAPLEAEGNRSAVTFYGFARLDAVFDDSRINNFQAPTAVRSEPTGAENQSNFTMHPRLTRFGTNYRAPGPMDSMGGATVNGKFEIDFFNGGSESRAIPRYRHVYLQLNWAKHSVLAGQTSDIISPMWPNINPHTLMWNAGNPGDRRAQFRYSYGSSTSAGFNLQAGLGLTGAINALDAENDGIRDGEASTMPNLQGRVGYNTPNSKVFLGFWSHYGREHTSTTFGGKNDFESYSYGGDFEFRFTPQVILRGELWGGSNMGDFRGSAGQSFNTSNGEEIDSRGGWIELGLRSGRMSFFTGYTADDPDNGQLGSGGITLNRSWYAHPQIRLATPVTTGIEYIYWQTKYKNLNEGTDNRFNLYIQYTY